MNKPPSPNAAPPKEHDVYKADHPSSDQIRHRWPELGHKLRRRWRKLTCDDVSFPNGNAEYLASVLQDRYGVDRREALLQVFEFESEL